MSKIDSGDSFSWANWAVQQKRIDEYETPEAEQERAVTLVHRGPPIAELPLPLELRLQIYKEIASPFMFHAFPVRPRDPETLGTRENFLALTETCRQMHNDLVFETVRQARLEIDDIKADFKKIGEGLWEGNIEIEFGTASLAKSKYFGVGTNTTTAKETQDEDGFIALKSFRIGFPISFVRGIALQDVGAGLEWPVDDAHSGEGWDIPDGFWSDNESDYDWYYTPPRKFLDEVSELLNRLLRLPMINKAEFYVLPHDDGPCPPLGLLGVWLSGFFTRPRWSVLNGFGSYHNFVVAETSFGAAGGTGMLFRTTRVGTNEFRHFDGRAEGLEHWSLRSEAWDWDAHDLARPPFPDVATVQMTQETKARLLDMWKDPNNRDMPPTMPDALFPWETYLGPERDSVYSIHPTQVYVTETSVVYDRELRWDNLPCTFPKGT